MEKQIKYFCEKRKLGLDRCLLVEMVIDNNQTLSKISGKGYQYFDMISSILKQNADFEGKLKEVPKMHTNIDTTDLDQTTQVL